MINQFIQNIFYHYILSEPTLTLKMEPDFFDSKNLQIAFQIAKEYVIKYHTAPSASEHPLHGWHNPAPEVQPPAPWK